MLSALSPHAAMGGFPIQTGFGPTNTVGGFANMSFGAPGLLAFGFPSPGIDPFFLFKPAASSFFINKELSYASGQSVNINIGPIPSTLGQSPFVLGLPFFGGGTGGVGGTNPFAPPIFPGGGFGGAGGGFGGGNPYGGGFAGGGNPYGGGFGGGFGNPYGGGGVYG